MANRWTGIWIVFLVTITVEAHAFFGCFSSLTSGPPLATYATTLTLEDLELTLVRGRLWKEIDESSLHRTREWLRLLIEVPQGPKEIIAGAGWARPISRNLMELYMHLILNLNLNPLRRAALENGAALGRSGQISNPQFGNSITEIDYLIINKINNLILSDKFDTLDVHLPKPKRNGWVTDANLFRQFLALGAPYPISPENVVRDDLYYQDWKENP